ncbi:MAG: folate hydrolase, partial [Bacteroidia bacterium]
MKPFLLSLFCLLPFCLLAQNPQLLGFSPESSATQYQLETDFDALLQVENLDQWMQRLSAQPHHVGSAYDRENVEFMAELFRSWGYETEIETFQVLLPYPKLRKLEMIAPTRYKAKLMESE